MAQPMMVSTIITHSRITIIHVKHQNHNALNLYVTTRNMDDELLVAYCMNVTIPTQL